MNFLVADEMSKFNQIGLKVNQSIISKPKTCLVSKEKEEAIRLMDRLEISNVVIVEEVSEVPAKCDIVVEFSGYYLKVILKESKVEMKVVMRQQQLEYLKMFVHELIPIQIVLNSDIIVPFLLANRVHWISNIRKVHSIVYSGRELYFTRIRNVEGIEHQDRLNWSIYVGLIMKVLKYSDFRLIAELCKESGDERLWYKLQNETGRMNLQLESFMINFSDSFK